MGTGDKILGSNLRWTSIPCRGVAKLLVGFIATETGMCSSIVGQFGSSAALTLQVPTVYVIT